MFSNKVINFVFFAILASQIANGNRIKYDVFSLFCILMNSLLVFFLKLNRLAQLHGTIEEHWLHPTRHWVWTRVIRSTLNVTSTKVYKMYFTVWSWLCSHRALLRIHHSPSPKISLHTLYHQYLRHQEQLSMYDI